MTNTNKGGAGMDAKTAIGLLQKHDTLDGETMSGYDIYYSLSEEQAKEIIVLIEELSGANEQAEQQRDEAMQRAEEIMQDRDYLIQDYIKKHERVGKLQAEAAAMREALEKIIVFGTSPDIDGDIVGTAMDALSKCGAKLPDVQEEADNG